MIDQAVTLEFTLPSPLPLKSNVRLHPRAEAARVRKLRNLVEEIARAEPTTIPTPTHCTVHLGWPDRRKRDALNSYPTVKACIDGLVRAGWFDDDDDEHLIGPDHRSFYAGRRGLVVLRFVFVPVVVPEQIALSLAVA